MKRLSPRGLLFALTFVLSWVLTPMSLQITRAHGGQGEIMSGTVLKTTRERSDTGLPDWMFAAGSSDKTSAHEGAETEKPTFVEEHNSTIWREMKEGFSFTFRTLGYGKAIEPSDSTQNPNNDFLTIPSYTLNLNLRPDVSLNFRRSTLVAKPRLNLTWESWEKGSREGDTDTDDDWFINEWLASLNVVNGLFVSYGREDIQWGPSALLSPSNPFFWYNGQGNPKEDLPGMDFARLVWVANTSWTASLLANLGRGRAIFPYGFEKTYALKIDYTTYKKYFSLIGSYQENNRGTLGGYGGWWVSDAMLLYAESSVSKGTNVLYPEKDAAAPFGIQMTPTKDDDNSPEGLILLGGSYTLESGANFTLDYLFNSSGYSDDEADRYYTLRDGAADVFFLPEPDHSLSKMTLIQTLDPRLRLLRRNYLMLQYYQVEIWDVLNLIFRYTYNIDDSSSQFVPIIEYDIGDYFQIFIVGDQRFGSKDAEFRSVLDYSYMLGVEFTF